MNTNNITELEEFVKNNYQNLGPKQIADMYGTYKCKITRIAKKFGLKMSHSQRSMLCIKAFEKSAKDFNVNHMDFENVTSPNIAYLLGLLWADGHISRRGTGHYIICSATITDELDLDKVFTKTGKWNKYLKKHDLKINPTWKPAITYQTSNKHLYALLEKLDYTNKTGCSPNKVINHIASNLRHYWWRGFFDGDGCIYTSGKKVQIAFAAPYEQNWGFAVDLMNTLSIENYASRKNVSKKGHKSSVFRFCSKSSAQKFMEYIYRGNDAAQIGLSRKYNKFSSFDFTYKIK